MNTRLEYGTYGSALAAAAYSWGLKCIESLVGYGAEMNAHLNHGAFGNALIAAVYANQVGCVKFLIGNGAEVSAYTEFGHFGSALVPALFARPRGGDRETMLEMIKYLIEELRADAGVLSSGPRHTSGDWKHSPQGWDSPWARKRAEYLMEEDLVERETLYKFGCPMEL